MSLTSGALTTEAPPSSRRPGLLAGGDCCTRRRSPDEGRDGTTGQGVRLMNVVDDRRERQEALHLSAAATSARQARRFVGEVCHKWDLDVVCDTAQLLVSEIVTNAIVHAGTPVELNIVCHLGVSLRTEVADASPAAPRLRPPRLLDEGGRGLEMVRRLASRWGVRQRGQGKVVWFELDL